jgi:hypothetical protein
MSVRSLVLKVFGSAALLTITMAPIAFGNGSGRFSSGCLANDPALQTRTWNRPASPSRARPESTIAVAPQRAAGGGCL